LQALALRRALGIECADDPYLGRELRALFPQALVERFPDALDMHGCAARFIATQLFEFDHQSRRSVLRVQIEDQTVPPRQDGGRLCGVRDSYGMTGLNTEIDGLDNMVSRQAQLELYAAVQYLFA